MKAYVGGGAAARIAVDTVAMRGLERVRAGDLLGLDVVLGAPDVRVLGPAA
jgi:hypothetical protein